jgi:hypothetical protein
MGGMSDSRPGWTGWVGYGPGPHGKDHLPPDVRAAVEQREHDVRERRGRLLCEVLVRVYEHDVPEAPAMYVTFPVDAALGPDSDQAEVAAAVERARQTLGGWR